MKAYIIGAIAFAILFSPAASAQETKGAIKKIQSYEGHTGLLVQLSVPMINPGNCGSAAWYILPDSSSRAAVEQSILLTAFARRDPVYIAVSGCYENYPKIRVIAVESN